MKKFSICIFLFLTITAIGQPENYRFKNVNKKAGLSHLDITAIHEDSRGYLWVGTTDGLNKLNGKNILVYKPLEDDSNSICSQSIRSIAEDKHGNLWFGTRDGLSLYKPKEDLFIHFTKVGDCENCLAGSVIRTMLVDGDKIWLGTNAGLSVIDINTYDIQSWWYDEKTDVVEVLFAIRKIIKAHDGRLLMATDEGLVIYDPESNRFSYFNEDDGLKTRGLGSVFRDSSGRYWLASDRDGVYHIEGGLDAPKFVIHPELIPEGRQKTTVYNFVERNNGELWIATHLGLTILDQRNDNVFFLHHHPNDNNSLSHNAVKELYQDSKNRIWIGGAVGVDIFDPYYNQFELLTHKRGGMNAISGTSVKAVYEDSKGFIWFGTQDAGLSIMEKKEDDDEHYYHIKKGSRSQDLKGNEVYYIEEDKEGKIWVSIPEGLHVIDWPDRSVFEYDIKVIEVGSIEDNKLPTPYIYQIYNDDDNTTWLTTHGEGLISLDSNNQYRQYKYVDQNPLYTSVDYITNVEKDHLGRIWLGNINLCGGVIRDPEKEDSYQRMKGDSALFGKNINDYSIVNDAVIISTNMGVYHFEKVNDLLDSRDAHFVRYNETAGMSNDFANVLIPQNENLFWVSTTDGISQINIATDEVKSYKDILSSGDRHFNHNAGLMTSDSFIYFGGVAGALRFNPYTILKNEERPRVYFKNFKILNEDVPISSSPEENVTSVPLETSYLKEIELGRKDKIFSLEMEVVNFRGGASSPMQYMLEGFDEEWQTTDNPLITRSNLDTGKYRLRARAANSNGEWSEEAVLLINVTGPWWKESWAFLIYGLLIIGLFQLLLYAKLRQERLVARIKNDEREKFRRESSKDFHDEAGTKLTRISLLTEILKKKMASNEDAENILSKIDQNLKELNIGMRDFIWSLNVENDNLLDTILRFAEFAHLFCEEANIQFKTNTIDPKMKEVKLEIAERRHILLILKEGLNNSVRHGRPEEIELDCSLKTGKIIIELKDNGHGFDPKTSSNGNGLANMKFRAAEIGARFSITSEPQDGCRIILELDMP